MSNLLKQFIKKKLIGNVRTKKDSPRNPFEIADFNNSVLFPTYAIKMTKEKSFTRSKNSIFFMEKDKRIEILEKEIMEFKKKVIDYYFSLKNSIIIDHV